VGWLIANSLARNAAAGSVAGDGTSEAGISWSGGRLSKICSIFSTAASRVFGTSRDEFLRGAEAVLDGLDKFATGKDSGVGSALPLLRSCSERGTVSGVGEMLSCGKDASASWTGLTLSSEGVN